MQQPSLSGELIKHFLDDARHSIDAGNAEQALQYVVQALQLLHGNNAVLPALRAAAEQYHAQRSAPIDELSRLLAHVSIAAEQQEQQLQERQLQQLQQQQQHNIANQFAHVYGVPSAAAAAPAYGSNRPILEETGRGSFTDAAMADGSSWVCPHCSGVVPLQRQQAHLAHWCPGLQQHQSSG